MLNKMLSTVIDLTWKSPSLRQRVTWRRSTAFSTFSRLLQSCIFMSCIFNVPLIFDKTVCINWFLFWNQTSNYILLLFGIRQRLLIIIISYFSSIILFNGLYTMPDSSWQSLVTLSQELNTVSRCSTSCIFDAMRPKCMKTKTIEWERERVNEPENDDTIKFGPRLR